MVERLARPAAEWPAAAAQRTGLPALRLPAALRLASEHQLQLSDLALTLLRRMSTQHAHEHQGVASGWMQTEAWEDTSDAPRRLCRLWPCDVPQRSCAPPCAAPRPASQRLCSGPGPSPASTRALVPHRHVLRVTRGAPQGVRPAHNSGPQTHGSLTQQRCSAPAPPVPQVALRSSSLRWSVRRSPPTAASPPPPPPIPPPPPTSRRRPRGAAPAAPTPPRSGGPPCAAQLRPPQGPRPAAGCARTVAARAGRAAGAASRVCRGGRRARAGWSCPAQPAKLGNPWGSGKASSHSLESTAMRLHADSMACMLNVVASKVLASDC